MLVYINNGFIYLPACSNVTNITVLANPIQDNRGFCPDNLDVKYTVNGVEKYGYLRNQRLITQFSTRSRCDEIKNHDMVVSNYRLKRSKISPFNITASNYSPIITKIHPLHPNLLRLSFHHDLITDNLNINSDMDKQIISDSNPASPRDSQYIPDFNFDVPQTPKGDNTMLDYFDNTVTNITGNWKRYVKVIAVIIILILILIMCLPAGVEICLKLVAKIFSSVKSAVRVKFTKKSNDSGDIEMGPFINMRNGSIINHL